MMKPGSKAGFVSHFLDVLTYLRRDSFEEGGGYADVKTSAGMLLKPRPFRKDLASRHL